MSYVRRRKKIDVESKELLPPVQAAIEADWRAALYDKPMLDGEILLLISIFVRRNIRNIQ